jgi:hypothetical protein
MDVQYDSNYIPHSLKQLFIGYFRENLQQSTNSNALEILENEVT